MPHEHRVCPILLLLLLLISHKKEIMKAHLTFAIAFHFKKKRNLFRLCHVPGEGSGKQFATKTIPIYLISGSEQNWERKSRSYRQRLRESNQLRTAIRTCFQGARPPQGPSFPDSSSSSPGVTNLYTFQTYFIILGHYSPVLPVEKPVQRCKNLWA